MSANQRHRYKWKNKKRTLRLVVFLAVAVIAVSLFVRLIGSDKSSKGSLADKPVSEIASVNGRAISSNLTYIEPLPEKHRKADMELQEAAIDSNNTFDKPLVIQDPFDMAPLTAVAVFTTDQEAGVRLTITGDTKSDTIVHEFRKSKHHIIPIVGLYPNRENSIFLEQIIDGRVMEGKEIKIKTGTLPSSLAGAVEVTAKGQEAVPGITVVSGQNSSVPYAFDSSGNIRWYLDQKLGISGYYPMSNGRFMVMNSNAMVPALKHAYSTHLYEMDFLGRIHNIYLIPDGAHHDIAEKSPSGNLLVISNTLDSHVEDMVVEIDRKTGRVVKEIKLADVLRNTFNSTYDWAGLSAVSYDPEDDTVLLSAGNLSSAVKVNWTTGEPVWILSNPGIWKGTRYESYVLKPEGATIWHYGQNSAYVIPGNLDRNSATDDILMFDNRNLSHLPVKLDVQTGLGKSSIVQYAVDKTRKTVREVKRLPGPYSQTASNYSLFASLDRVVAFHANVVSNGKSCGYVYEYELSSGRVVRSYRTKNAFYRGYRQEFPFDAAAKPMSSDDNPVKGELHPAVKMSGIPAPSDTMMPSPDMWISGGILYIRVPDLSVTRVQLSGKLSAWESVFTGDTKKIITVKQMKKGTLPESSLKYAIAVPLNDLPGDTYSVNLEYYGVPVSTSAKIEIK